MFELDQTIFYMKDNKVCSAPILSIMTVQNSKKLDSATPEQRKIFNRFGRDGIFISTIHGEFEVDGETVFATKQELLDSL